MRTRACAAFLAAASWSTPAFAADPTVAREQLKIGYQLAQDGKCDEAVPHLVESLRLDAKAITLINLADCEEKIGKLADAMSHWVDARSRAQTEGAPSIQEEAERRATQLDPRLPRLTIRLARSAPSDAVVERDGVVLGAPSLGIPLPLDPGAHTITVKMRGRLDAATSVTLAEGESQQVEVEAGSGALAPAPLPPRSEGSKRPGMRALAIGGFGVGAVGLAVGGLAGMSALGAGSDARKACPDHRCSQQALDDIDTGRTIGTVSTVGFIVAGIGVAVGIYGLVASRRSATPVVSIAPSRAALGGRF